MDASIGEDVSKLGTEPQRGLLSASFGGLVLTQLLTAVNDNAFRWLAIGLGKHALEQSGDEEHIGLVLMAGTACFVLPYLILAAPAGYLADRFSKRSVIVSCKVAEIGLAVLGVAAMLTGSVVFLLAVVGLFGMQSALFSPSRLGSIPEILPVKKISSANGLMGLTTVVATVIGMALGNVLADQVRDHFATGVAVSAAVLIGCAVLGWLASLLITRLAPADPTLAFPLNPLPKMGADLRDLASSRPLLRVALGIMFFWSVGALAQLNIDQFAFESGATRQTQIVPLLLSLVAGVGLGSVLAGYWSAGRVELGILPLGAAGLVLNAVLLFFVPPGVMTATAAWLGYYGWTAFLLFALGVSAGLFDVPLESYLQHHSPPQSRGSVLAASNLITFGGILVTAVLFAGLRAPLRDAQPLLTSRQIFLLSGLLTIPVFVYIVWLIPQASIRFLVWLASRTVYRIRVFGLENLPQRGGALLVANHVSWLDGPLMLLTSSRPVRVLAFAGNFQNRWTRRLADLFGVILISSRPKSIVAALQTARQALQSGELVCIFPEGAITRTGQMQAFRPGLLKILEGTGAPVVPVYLDELWGSIFSFHGGRFFWKRPQRWPYPISIFFGHPVANPMDVHPVRQAVQELGAMAVEQRANRASGLARSFVRTCKKRKRGSKIADSLGNELSGGGLLTRSLILRRLLARHVLDDGEQFVGLLLPPSVAGVVANAACSLARRVPVNLNYTVTSEVINECLRQASIRHVITSRQFMEKVKLEVDAELVYLEDFRSKAGFWDKLACAIAAYGVPAALLERSLDLHRVTGDDLATIIFTSGSTGVPKGVMLTQTNVGSNVDAIEQIIHLHRSDVLVGILPFFHSFGYTVCLWAAMSIDVKGVYHFNPLEAKQVGKLVKKHRGTVLLATPTFLRSYLRRCDTDELATLDAIVTGAERLPKDLCDAFEAKFGVRPVEGYGTTELSPLVSANIPPSRSPSKSASDWKEGTVGRPAPGISAKVTDLDSGAELGVGRPGMLWVKGPNVMKGYLGRDDLTAEVIREGWYMTGDIALIDEEGFIQITGRQSRFSKIGGEMVPHLKIEEALAQVIGADEEEGFRAVVTAVSDEKKGERIVVLHTSISKTPEQLRKGLSELGLPNLYIPSEDSFYQVETIPVLGTGKLDLRGVKQIASQVFGSGQEESP
ncbi:MAG: acyl-[ACP]--phospholipid O-acyltransferase [Pirellulaceae bacterium]|jgi:acyl-[acyl-carrier-protein]-phospholipid O-acyltransferase/long-chain-fatty-acid--[acyl-carrier-protein] ligase|nr:acyl-[ACP]--phospholipid O-acyltransferase [Pirellulaceae bacterium]